MSDDSLAALPRSAFSRIERLTLAPLALLGLVACVVIAWLAWRRVRRSRREKLFEKPLPDAWIRLIQNNVPLYRTLPRELRQRLHGHINVFLDEKTFIGCGGLEMNDEIRLSIAAQACMLLLNRDADYFPGFKTILVYPDTYVAKETVRDGMIETLEEDARAGESWHRGPVVLSWDDVIRSAEENYEGENVVLHEFAHKLDEENDQLDGLPVLDEPEQYESWARVLKREFESLKASVDRDEATVLDDYGAESPAEFFAVVTETFFERPSQLKAGHPELYAELSRFYRLDPASWRAGDR